MSSNIKSNDFYVNFGYISTVNHERYAKWKSIYLNNGMKSLLQLRIMKCEIFPKI
ncbi:MAG: hypothetical protein BAJALOKI2v1_390050 [Promethearchaeota archaeon]|nr:MAG: hypothetical protein BAJALOKI2v1_390050 [Candidatus Lokiarchaeota archaeon]